MNWQTICEMLDIDFSTFYEITTKLRLPGHLNRGRRLWHTAEYNRIATEVNRRQNAAEYGGG